MNIRELRYFTSMSYTQHYQHTADIFNVSQPAVSRAIAALENELGAPLFEKQGRNVVLTRYLPPLMRQYQTQKQAQT